MRINKLNLIFSFLVFVFLFSAPSVFSEDGSQVNAEKLMKWQLNAIKKDDYNLFIQNGNKAFKELYNDWQYDTIILKKRDKILKGYSLKYLGPIRRIGMIEHLWKVKFNGEKNEVLGRLTVSHGKVVGFDLD